MGQSNDAIQHLNPSEKKPSVVLSVSSWSFDRDAAPFKRIQAFRHEVVRLVVRVQFEDVRQLLSHVQFVGIILNHIELYKINQSY